MLLAIVTFVPIIAFLIFFHEMGHFITAKAYGVKVLEFGFGYPPRLFGIRRGETLYSINLLPLGGFVKMMGEEDPSHPRSLASRSVFKRFVVISAGSFMNIVLPVVIFSALFMFPQQTVVGLAQIQEVIPDSPAEAAGLRAGDTILRVDGHAIRNVADLILRINLRLGAESEWVIRKGGTIPLQGASPEFASTEVVRIVPRFNQPEGQGPTGIVIATVNGHLERVSYPFWDAIPRGVIKVGHTLILTKNEISRWITGASAPQLAGPVGIAQLTGQVAQPQFEGEAATSRVVRLLELGAFLSINLAIINIMPIPMLDGGRLFFIAIEWVRRGKRISPEKEGLVHMVGFVLLITLIIIISYFDIARIIRGESLF